MTRSLLATVALVVLAACGSDGDSTGPVTSGARLRVLHMLPDGPVVDARIDGNRPPELANVAFGTASPYLDVSVRTSVVTLQAAPSVTADDPRPLITSSRIPLERARDYTYVVTGRFVSPTPEEAPGFTIYQDDTSAVAATQSRVRVIHASPDAGPVDVYALPANSATIPAGSTPLVSGLAFRSARTVTVPPGTYALLVTPLGNRTTIATSLPSVGVSGGNAFTVVARGFAGGTPPAPQRLALQVVQDR